MKTTRLTKETILDLAVVDRNFPDFRVGDTLNIAQKVKEGAKERIQYFEGDVIDIHNKGAATTFTVRRIGANGVGVEKIFPYYSENIADMKLVRRGRVRRAKLTYLRARLGKEARVQEIVISKAAAAKASKKAEAAE
ncbi:MAG: 50S ribosomal protein L19 [candidate division TM6 bacterium GW2011_GWF2_37_49]|nr:MAG: 50S ribosomal protein L19 [candidate division TM6 bacterium GW2011_GWF2_37_49]